jgi:Protease inhibitor Inh
MIPKSGNRFSEKIMRKKESARRIAGGLVMTVMLGACASEGPTPPAPLQQFVMIGRWMLSAPNAPACGMEFEGEPGQQQGAIRPDGGCPGNFFMSRHWTFAQDMLTIADQDNAPLAQLKLTGDRFAGQSTAGVPVTLAR